MQNATNVTEGEDAFSYRVSSESGQACYSVDLLAENGAGRCDCKDWQFRCSPAIAKGERKRCKHVSKALNHLAQAIIDRRIEQLRELETKSDRIPTEYAALAAEFKRQHPRCGVCGTNPVDDIHHSRGRLGSLLSDTRFWIPTCRTCHAWIDSNRNAARELTWNGVPVLCEKGEWNSPPAE